MAEAAPPGSLPSDSLHLRGIGLKAGRVLKRKTPSELREEQLKRRKSAGIVDDSASALHHSTLVDGVENKPDAPKNTKYAEMRLDKVYPAKKPSSGLRLLSCKTTSKLQSVSGEENTGIKSCFRSVAELSLGNNIFAEIGSVNVDKALKGLVSREHSVDLSHTGSSARLGDLKPTSSGKINSEFNVLGGKIPIDFTLKTSLRILSSSPNIWFHRLLMAGTYTGMNSWVYPQSSLSPNAVSALSSVGEDDILTKRQLAWKDSFRDLYYMLRKNKCDIFYVYTLNFVVLFTATCGAGKNKRISNAYISQSTRGLRSLLSEHDVSFSMPLCFSEEEQISRDDLVELSEIERQNLGQAKRFTSVSDVDNSPQSLLLFSGNESVHGLYDVLFNYKSFLALLTGMDVPMLYSPVPFRYASIQSPQFRCKEIKTADHHAARLLDTVRKDGKCSLDSSGGINYSIEVKDAYLPPWIIISICGTMVSAGCNFEASFSTDPNSAGLNVALQKVDEAYDNPQDIQTSSATFGITGTVDVPELMSSSLKRLKYKNGSYAASIYSI